MLTNWKKTHNTILKLQQRCQFFFHISHYEMVSKKPVLHLYDFFGQQHHTKVEQYRLLGWSSRMLPWCNSTYICSSVCPMMMPSTAADCHFGQKAVSQYTATKIQILTYSKFKDIKEYFHSCCTMTINYRMPMSVKYSNFFQ